MLKIGLTGGIGSGKTSLAKIFESLGVKVYYSDYWAKYLTSNDIDIISKLKKEFGDDIYLKNNELDKLKLSKLIFNDKIHLQKVNDIIHPVVKAHFNNWVENQKNNNEKYIIKEAAILFESAANKQVDKVITVLSDLNLRIKRIQNRDGISIDEIKSKISSQMTDEEKIKLSDYVIYNNEKDMLLPQVLKLHNSFN
jgi:dephospho-CoA kinase